jgi:hypothetical protein
MLPLIALDSKALVLAHYAHFAPRSCLERLFLVSDYEFLPQLSSPSFPPSKRPHGLEIPWQKWGET